MRSGDKKLESKKYCSRLDVAKRYSEVWEIVKATVKSSLNERRVGMLLFLDDLPPPSRSLPSLGK